MAVTIGVKYDERVLKKEFDAFTKGAEKAIDAAQKDAAKRGKVAFLSGKTYGGAPTIYNVKKKDIEGYVRCTKAGITVESRVFTIGSTHFSITPQKYVSQKELKLSKRPKRTLTVKKGHRVSVKHLFVVNPARTQGNTLLFKRSVSTGGRTSPTHKEKGDPTIDVVRTLSAAQMASNPEIEENVTKAITEQYEKRLEHYIKRFTK